MTSDSAFNMKQASGAFLRFVAAPLLLATAYYGFLGHRTDYIGHYLAGFAGTLGAAVVVLAAIPPREFRSRAAAAVVAVALASIALGGWFEATIYRLARFDEVDFCNQSLGAALAGLALLAVVREGRPTMWLTAAALLWAGCLMAGGYHFAFLDRTAAAILLTVGIALAGGNLWFTAARSTIPLVLDTTVLSRETRREKHPGTDDVFLWHTADGRTLAVDRAVTEAVPRDSARLTKRAFSRMLLYNGERVRLSFSPDFHGMKWVMPLAMVLLVLLALVPGRSARDAKRPKTAPL